MEAPFAGIKFGGGGKEYFTCMKCGDSKINKTVLNAKFVIQSFVLNAFIKILELPLLIKIIEVDFAVFLVGSLQEIILEEAEKNILLV